ncbi:unnamed protein product [Owenia fusiformis]|uniref:Uncharacterized protein n=1 Tax=Owenia fusiformis TaxID=6347 RepID=A0A8J1U5X6_OWEFU|nr:unnamed protein product [Owenia fusiformis]
MAVNPIKSVLYYVSALLVLLGLILLLPVLLPISLYFRIYRLVLKRMILNSPDAVKGHADLVPAGDAIWLQDSPENKAIINAIAVLKGRPDIAKLQQILMDRLINAKNSKGELLYRKLQQKFVKKYHRDVFIDEDNFDIKDHVYQYEGALPKTKNDVQKIISMLSWRAIDPEKAAWEIIVIPEIPVDDPDDGSCEYAFLLRFHHALADGMSLVKLFITRIVDKDPSDQKITNKNFGGQNKVAQLAMAALFGPYILLERILWPADDSALHGPEVSGEKNVAWSRPIDLALIKKIKNAAKATVNDVLMACLGGALRKHLTDNDLPVPESMLAMIPVDLRGPVMDEALENHFGLVYLPLPTNIEDPMQRLKYTKSNMDAIKSSPEPLVSELMIKYSMSRFPTALTRPLYKAISEKSTMVLSNVPGPQHVLRLGGQAITTLIFWPPQKANVGLGISILSYAGEVRMGLIADKAVIADPGPIPELFEQQIKTMAKLLNVKND